MLSYDYECKCGHVWSFYQDGWEEQYNCKLCPVCSSNKITRQFPAPVGIISYVPEHPRHGRGRTKRKMTINEGLIRPNTDEKVGPIRFRHTLED